ncbi:hypothetical protein, partial [Klebsiella pneumoniae]|uniref:hypothetical protein n=1 Tax=Klebsiella pneumoniae TaxID=573 RepID=UPI002108B7BA
FAAYKNPSILGIIECISGPTGAAILLLLPMYAVGCQAIAFSHDCCQSASLILRHAQASAPRSTSQATTQQIARRQRQPRQPRRFPGGCGSLDCRL